MAARKPVPPYLTLSEDAVIGEPASGWQLFSTEGEGRLVADRTPFPSWDSSLDFELRRSYYINFGVFSAQLGVESAQCTYRLITRMETGRGRISTVVDDVVIDGENNVVEVSVKPNSGLLSQDLTLLTSVVIMDVDGEVGELAPTVKGARLWQNVWSVRLEGGRARLPMEAVSFSKGSRGHMTAGALYQVQVVDDAALDFEEAVCVYLNSDFPRFVSAVERGDPVVTGMLWDAVVRQLLNFGLSADFLDEQGEWQEGSLGAQFFSWIGAIFPNEQPARIKGFRDENSGLFEARIQSWIKAGAFWEVKNR